MRKLIFPAIAIFGSLIVLTAIYFFFFANKGGGVSVINQPSFPSANNVGATVSAPPVGQQTGSAGEEIAPRLIRITKGPVAFGSVVFKTTDIIVVKTEPNNASSTATTSKKINNTEVRYAERESGNVYAYRAEERTLTRLSNETIPGIIRASWTPNGGVAFMQRLSDTAPSIIETYYIRLGEEYYPIEQGLSDIVVNASGTTLVVLPSTSGTIGSLVKADGSGVTTLFGTDLSSLKILASGKNYIAHTKATSEISGYGFLIDGKTGIFERLLGPLTGLTMLASPSGKKVLYSRISGNEPALAVLDTTTHTSINLPLKTLTEKCVWAYDETKVYCAEPKTASAGLPDSWYQGRVSFSDKIWEISLTERIASLVFDGEKLAGTPIDAVSLATDSAGDKLLFTNKIDSSLWIYSL